MQPRSPPPQNSRCRELYQNYKTVCRSISYLDRGPMSSPCSYLDGPEADQWLHRFEECYQARLDHHRECIGLPNIDSAHRDYLTYLQDEMDLCSLRKSVPIRRPEPIPEHEVQIINRLRYLWSTPPILTLRERDQLLTELKRLFANHSGLEIIETIHFYNPFDPIIENHPVNSTIDEILSRYRLSVLQTTRWALLAYGSEAIVNESGEEEEEEEQEEQEDRNIRQRQIASSLVNLFYQLGAESFNKYLQLLVFRRYGTLKLRQIQPYLQTRSWNRMLDVFTLGQLRRWKTDDVVTRDVMFRN